VVNAVPSPYGSMAVLNSSPNASVPMTTTFRSDNAARISAGRVLAEVGDGVRGPRGSEQVNDNTTVDVYA